MDLSATPNAILDILTHVNQLEPIFRIRAEDDNGGTGDLSNLAHFIVNSNGDVGIGLGVPQQKLHVSGSGLFSNDLYVSQRIGISTTSPIAALHIPDGDIFMSNGSFTLNSSFGSILMDDGLIRINSLLVQDGALMVKNTNRDISIQNGAFSVDNPNGDILIQNGTFSVGNPNGNLLVQNGELRINDPNGMRIGTTQILLKPDGMIRAREIRVYLGNIPDYVFKENYPLMPLTQLRKYIKEKQHLPNIKSEQEYIKEGSIALKDLSLKLLEKVEELTLYILQQEEKLNKQQVSLDTLQQQTNQLNK